MKNVKCFVTAALCAAFLYSCSGVEKELTPATEKKLVEVKFASNGITAMETKVVDDMWGVDDKIGVFMVEHGTADVVNDAENIRFSNSDISVAPGAPMPFTSSTPIYYPDESDPKVDFIAYHPWQGTLTNWKYNIDVVSQSSQSAIDLIRADADNSNQGYDKSRQTPIVLNFSHKLVKIVMNIQAGNGVDEAELEGLVVKITNQQTLGELDLSSRSNLVIPAANTPAAIVALTEPDGLSSQAIILPNSTTSEVEFTFTTFDGVTYATAIPASHPSWESGYQYTYNITLARNAVRIEGLVELWEDGGEEDATGYPR